jgi:hypothetical protein
MFERHFELSAHAALVIAERRIELEWIERAMSKPGRTETGSGDASLMHALVRIPERDGRMLRAVYNARTDPPRIVTAYFDRKLKDRP